MNSVIKTAVETFKDASRFWGEDGQWVADNIQSVMEHVYNMPSGEQFHFNTYIKDTYGDEKVSVAMCNLMPYMTGPYGVLDMTFETADGEKVKVGAWELAKEIGKENVWCVTEDGRRLSQNEVYVIFRRNDRKEIMVKAPYKNFDANHPYK
jgi:hypothetical protein